MAPFRSMSECFTQQWRLMRCFSELLWKMRTNRRYCVIMLWFFFLLSASCRWRQTPCWKGEDVQKTELKGTCSSSSCERSTRASFWHPWLLQKSTLTGVTPATPKRFTHSKFPAQELTAAPRTMLSRPQWGSYPEALAAEDLKCSFCLPSPWTLTPCGQMLFTHCTYLIPMTYFVSLRLSGPNEYCCVWVGVSCPHSHSPRCGQAYNSRDVPSTSPCLCPGKAASDQQHSGTTNGLRLTSQGLGTQVLPNP